MFGVLCMHIFIALLLFLHFFGEKSRRWWHDDDATNVAVWFLRIMNPIILRNGPENSGEASRPVCLEQCGHPVEQNGSSSLSLFASVSTDVPCRWTPPARGLWRSTSSTNRLVTIADWPPYAAVNHRRSSIPGRRCCPCLERFAALRHVGTISGCLPQSPQDASLQALLSIAFRCCALVPAMWRSSLSDTLIVSFNFITYLLTYLLTYYWFRCQSTFSEHVSLIIAERHAGVLF